VISTAPPVDLDGPDTALLAELIGVWRAKRPRNLLRSVYYDGEKALKDFGISLPPQMQNIGAALGWTAKGVHAVTDRSRFEGFVSASGGNDPFGLEELQWDNRFKIEFPAASVSSAVHGCSFLTVTQGDVQSGEPEVLILARAAEDSAALWDNRKRRLRGFLSVVELDDSSDPIEMVLYSPSAVYSIVKAGRKWAVDRRPNPLGVVSVAPLVHKFELRRPLGHSRITRAAMYYSDAALRTIVRSEVSAEFYSAPEYWLFGTDVSAFQGADKWSAIMGRIKALDIEDGEDKPDLHRFSGASAQPHTEQLRMWANLFADEQDLDVKFADASNPSSADAIFAAKETLITTTRDANTLWGDGGVQAMQFAVRLRDRLAAVPTEMRSLTAQFTDPAIVSPTARADAFTKLSASIEGFGVSEVGMEYAGLTREQIIRFQAERRRERVGTLASALASSAAGAVEGNPDVAALGAKRSEGDMTTQDAETLKAKFDALGIAVRAGVDPDSAAGLLGLAGLEFTGATPVALRLPEAQAAGLEDK